jgi:hypothetical protein
VTSVTLTFASLDISFVSGRGFSRATSCRKKEPALAAGLWPFHFAMPIRPMLSPVLARSSSLRRFRTGETFSNRTGRLDYLSAYCTAIGHKDNFGCTSSWSCPIIFILCLQSNATCLLSGLHNSSRADLHSGPGANSVSVLDLAEGLLRSAYPRCRRILANRRLYPEQSGCPASCGRGFAISLLLSASGI